MEDLRWIIKVIGHKFQIKSVWAKLLTYYLITYLNTLYILPQYDTLLRNNLQ